MILSKSLPTIFAKHIAMGVDMYLPESNGKIDEWEFWHDRLVIFQQMAVHSNLEMCMTVYLGVELSEEQVSMLEIIYNSTKPWLMGHVVGELIEKVSNKLQSGRDTAEVARTILENFGKGKSPSEQTQRGLLVRFAHITPGEVVTSEKEDDNDE